MSVDNLSAIGTRDEDIDVYCTLSRDKKRKNKSSVAIANQRHVLTRRLSGSHENLYTGTRVSRVPEPTEYAVKVSTSCTLKCAYCLYFTLILLTCIQPSSTNHMYMYMYIF